MISNLLIFQSFLKIVSLVLSIKQRFFYCQIQEQQIEQESWANLPQQERSQNEAQLMHIGRLARYHNIMGTGKS